ncbi:hypothetical protein [Roseivirga seohaensis]|nr:hypothetical protein [Roseivirga seohaensis]
MIPFAIYSIHAIYILKWNIWKEWKIDFSFKMEQMANMENGKRE